MDLDRPRAPDAAVLAPVDAAPEGPPPVNDLVLTLAAERFVPSPDRVLPLEIGLTPGDAGAFDVTWQTLEGPASALFSRTGPLSVKVSFRVSGTYKLKVEVRAGDRVAQAITVVHVLEVQSGLVAHWAFEEEDGLVAQDDGPQGYALTFKSLQRDDGVVGRAVLLSADGDDGVLGESGNASIEKLADGDFAVSLWFREAPPVTPPNAAVILRYVAAPAGNQLGWEVLMLDSGILVFQSFGPMADTDRLRRAGLRDGRWHHVVAQRRRGDLELWVDGRFSTRGPGPLAKVAASFTVGGAEGMAWGDFDGALDEVQIFARALAQDEIRYLANPEELASWRALPR